MFPRRPSMSLTSTRIGTFYHGWSPVHASVREIAAAGFFFLGDRDRVVCWYCNGGLQNWKFEDDPWHEHAKWYSTCPFLLEKKGSEYVSGVTAMYPSINRPRLRIPFPRLSSTSALTSNDPNSDPQTSQTPDSEPQPSDSDPQTSQTLDSDPQTPVSDPQTPPDQPCDPQPSHDSARGCKICFSAKADIAFVPCGHICSCINCSERLFNCPLCRSLITTSVRVYIP